MTQHRFTELNILCRIQDVTFGSIERLGLEDATPTVVGLAVKNELSIEIHKLGLDLGVEEIRSLGVLALSLARAVARDAEDPR